MSIDVREMTNADRAAACEFMAAVPNDDRTFFKEDITDPAVVEQLVAGVRTIRRVAVDDQHRIVAFAALFPGVARTSHVAELRLVVAADSRGQGIGRRLARAMLLEAVRHGFRKVVVDIAADNPGAIEMFRVIGFQPEALLRDHLRDADGELRDLVVLAHGVDEQWSSMLTAGIDEAIG